MQHRAVGFGRRQGDRQPAARLGVAEQHVRECLADGLAGQPGIDHRADLAGPRHQHRHAGVHHHHRARAGGGGPADKLVLPAGKGQGVPVVALAFRGLRRADHHDGQVRGGGRGLRLGHQRLLVRRGRDAQPQRHRSLAGGRRAELHLDDGVLAAGQRDLPADLTRAGHGLDRVGRDLGLALRRDRPVHGDREPSHARGAEQVGPAGLRPEGGAEPDDAALAPAHARWEPVPPGQRRCGTVLAGDHLARRGAELQPHARLAGDRVDDRAAGRFGDALPGPAAGRRGHRGLAPERVPQRLDGRRGGCRDDPGAAAALDHRMQRVRADHRDPPDAAGVEGQYRAVVVQQHQRGGHGPAEQAGGDQRGRRGPVTVGGTRGVTVAVGGGCLGERAHPAGHAEQPGHLVVHHLLGHQAGPDGLGQRRAPEPVGPWWAPCCGWRPSPR